jgi:hypothetical protein
MGCGAMTLQQPVRIPPEAREGLMRAWLEILRQRHPDIVWMPVEPGPDRPPSPARCDCPKTLWSTLRRPDEDAAGPE